MPLPTSYTYETFRDYLEKDVLGAVAAQMAWVDNFEATEVSVPIVGSKVADSRWLVLTGGLTFDVPAGTKIPSTTISGTTGLPLYVTTHYDAVKGEDRIFLTTDEGANARSFNTNVLIKTGNIQIDAQSIYDSITNETLVLLGYSTPESVPADKIREFRALGRVEVWRAVVYNTLTDTDITIGDSTLQRGQVNETALNQMEFAETEYNAEFGPVAVRSKPNTATTYAGSMKVRF